MALLTRSESREKERSFFMDKKLIQELLRMHADVVEQLGAVRRTLNYGIVPLKIANEGCVRLERQVSFLTKSKIESRLLALTEHSGNQEYRGCLKDIRVAEEAAWDLHDFVHPKTASADLILPTRVRTSIIVVEAKHIVEAAEDFQLDSDLIDMSEFDTLRELRRSEQ